MARFNTNQEVMDHVVPFLKKQGKRAGTFKTIPLTTEDTFVCEYLADDGSRCAIGACFEDPAPLVNYDLSITSLINGYPILYQATFGPDVKLSFLRTLQQAHDNAHDNDFWSTFSAKCQSLCNRWGLTMPEVN